MNFKFFNRMGKYVPNKLEERIIQFLTIEDMEKVENVIAATERLGVDYAVAIDNDGRTWRAYRQRYWPTRYVLDKNGHIRYQHIGEGAYDESEQVIQILMAEPAGG
jgi:hypothetical protein